MNALKFQLQRARRAAFRPAVHLRDRVLLSDRGAIAAGWPVRASSSGERREPFFVLGSPRSGTTLLRSILCAHPDVFIPPENGAFLRMIRVFMSLRTSTWDAVVTGVLDAFREGYEFDKWAIDLDTAKLAATSLPPEARSLVALIDLLYAGYGETHAPGKRSWGDKSTPGNYDYLGKLSLVFPNALYVHIVRDGRDCVASCIRAGFFDESYYEAAYAWRDNVKACRRLGGHLAPGRFLEIRYEELVSSAPEAVARLCEFLRLTPVDSMLEPHRGSARAVPDVERVEHHANVRRPISTDSLGKWRSQLPSAQMGLVNRILGPELRACGYND